MKTETTKFHEQTLAINEALMLGSVRQHELTEAADSSNVRLKEEIIKGKRAEEALHRVQAQLAAHAGKLEGLVAERTSELVTTNKRLEGAVRFIRKANEEHQLLFLESQVMQKKLHQQTRRIITIQEEERKRISRELHDVVVQTLIGLNIKLTTLNKGVTVTLKKRIAHIQQLVVKAVNEVHRFARELRPMILDDLGLIAALDAYNRNLAKRKKLKIHMTAFGRVEMLGDAERTVLFRVAQEALTNVARHARATLVKMSISEIPGAIRMEINDNGKSFHVEKTVSSKNPKRLGLVGMKERIEMVGGRLTIESVRGKGTTVRAEIPFTPEKTKK
jgi:signal transduction histidine kinase